MRQEAALCAQRWGTTRAAHILELSPRTLRHWRKHRARRPTHSRACEVGLPSSCPVPVRNEVIQFLHRVTGPSVGLPALRCLFPGIRRCVLAGSAGALSPHLAAALSAARLPSHLAPCGSGLGDGPQRALQPVDGVSPYLLAVRDLASHRQLAWHPVQTVTAEETLPILLDLFRQYGAPLVLKNDNGSAFIAELLRHAMQPKR